MDRTVDAVNLAAAGGEVTLKTYPGLGHVQMVLSLAAPFRAGKPQLGDIAAFIAAHKPAPE